MKEEKENMDPKQKKGLEALNEALKKCADTVEPESITPSLGNRRPIPKYIPNKKG